MKRPTFLQGAVVAAIMAVTGAAGFAGLSILTSSASALTIVTMALAGAYVLYLLHGASERTGRIAIFILWSIVTTLVLIFTEEPTAMLIAQVLLLSLIRSLYYYTSVLSSLLDLGLSALAISAAAWASIESHSLFLSIWSFFLVQALFAGIPVSTGQPEPAPDDDAFRRALRHAEAAVKRIATQR